MKSTSGKITLPQCQKPSGWLGRFVVWRMNSHHSKLTDWGLSHVSIKSQDIILDVGCGGGTTVAKLAAMANEGKIYGLDFSDVSLAIARKRNAELIARGRVEIHEGTVSDMPFNNEMFDLVIAVETHFWWPDLPVGAQEVRRVLKPGGTFIIIAETYKGASTKLARLAGQYASRTGLKLLTVGEHRDLLVDGGYGDVRITEGRNEGWICAVGKKPLA
jgi:ubiquinone/menaquinone biosynthesis C-methylase UbiE